MNKQTIVFIDDEPDILIVSVFRLKKMGYRVLTAIDGEQGLNLIRREMPCMVFLDLIMPGKDGYQVCRELKADNLTSHIPVILFTAGEENNVPQAVKDTGADGYLLKPFMPKELLGLVKKHMPDNG